MRGRQAAALITLTLITGCGGDDGPSSQEFESQVDARTRAVAAQFDQTFTELARVSGDGKIPAAAKREIRDLAAAQRAAADDIEAQPPPEGAEEATAALVEGLREHAGRLDTAAQRERLTFDQLTAATAPPPELVRAISDLRAQDIEVARPLPGG